MKKALDMVTYLTILIYIIKVTFVTTLSFGKKKTETMMAQRKEKKVITFPIKLDPCLHKALKHVAVEERVPLQRLIIETLRIKVDSDSFLNQRTRNTKKR